MKFGLSIATYLALASYSCSILATATSTDVRFENLSSKEIAVVMFYWIPSGEKNVELKVAVQIIPPSTWQTSFTLPALTAVALRKNEYWIGKSEDYKTYIYSKSPTEAHNWLIGKQTNFYYMPFNALPGEGFLIGPDDDCVYYMRSYYFANDASLPPTTVTPPPPVQLFSAHDIPITVLNSSRFPVTITFPDGESLKDSSGKTFRSVVCIENMCNHYPKGFTIAPSQKVAIGYQIYTGDINASIKQYTGVPKNIFSLTSMADLGQQVFAPVNLYATHRGFLTLMQPNAPNFYSQGIDWIFSEFGAYTKGPCGISTKGASTLSLMPNMPNMTPPGGTQSIPFAPSATRAIKVAP